MPPASSRQAPVHIRRHQPVPVDDQAADEVLCDEAGRWGIYGQVDSQRIDDDRHAITTVTPRLRGSRIALLSQVDASRDHTLHDQEPHRVP